jgi:hypothetical membrane protein
MARKGLLVCGVLASLLYVGTDMLAALRNDGYSYTAQTVSELFAIGSPTRPLVVPLLLTYGVLVVAFGLGVRESARSRRSLRVTAGLLIGYGVACLLGPFTPMHLRGAETTLTDTLHIIGAMVDVLLILLIIGFGANTFGRRFRRYSLGTILVLLVSGALAGLNGPRIAANLPTPWVGVTERISIYVSMLWVAVLAMALLRVRDTAASSAFVTDNAARSEDEMASWRSSRPPARVTH